MEAIKNTFNYKKIVVNSLFLFLFTLVVVNINQEFPYYYDATIRTFTHLIISSIAVFYTHGLVLLPILQEEQDKKKYKNYLVVIGLLYFLFLLFFWFGNPDFYVRKSFYNADGSLIESLPLFFMLSIIPLSFTTVLSYAYSAIVLGKKVAYQFLEFFVNLVVVSLLFIVAGQSHGWLPVFLLSVMFIVFYTNVFYATPLLFKSTRNKIKYWMVILVMTFFYYVVMLSVFFSQFTHLPRFGKIFNNVIVLLGILILIYLLSFIYGYFRIRILSKEKLFALKLGAKDSELKLLKSQVNPHFLFNMLNTLYSTALEEKAEKTAQSTAKLASLIRYMQEDINKDFIPLENEIKYLNDYINIQELRCAVQPTIETEFVNIKNHKISPGLLIPFVENAFKYGIDPSKPSTLRVSVICNDNTINFECVNSYKDDFKTYYKEQGFGIGIKNAKQRLELVYPKKHTFSITKENQLFSVNISINTR